MTTSLGKHGRKTFFQNAHSYYRVTNLLAALTFSDIYRHAWFNSTWFNFKSTAFTIANTAGRQLKYTTNSGVKWVPLKPQTGDYCQCFDMYTVSHDLSAVKLFYGIQDSKNTASTKSAAIKCANTMPCFHIHCTPFISLGHGHGSSRLDSSLTPRQSARIPHVLHAGTH